MASAAIKSLRPFASCDIGDALVKLKYPFGGFLDGISMWSPERQGHLSGKVSAATIGEAVTVKIMYIQQPKDMYSACFGGLMGLRSKTLGAAGVVVDGRFRDVQEIQELGLPLYARGISILGSNTFTRASEINIPLQFKGDLWIHPGDILVGDHDGVVVVPPSLVEQVVALCSERKEIDDKTMKALRDGMPMGEALKTFRK
ncbi:RraA-like protein [Mollisia scopiformis]|uniref:RraA-like protein n=1 Tax=Mollisia scopiformis TaxID=149040 RepID=A0A194WXK2_MOLSC|nr:RraA-like protein [Mollisia scopiformis]KUJ12404.1 RraA-like protein [Mollisia scopiformis]